MLKSKKILIIFLLTAILLIFSISSCFASESEKSFEGSLSDDVWNKVHEVMEQYNFTDYIFCYSYEFYSDYGFLFFNSSETGILYLGYNNKYEPFYGIYTSNECDYVYYPLSVFTNPDYVFDSGLFHTRADSWFIRSYDCDRNFDFTYSTVDIYDSNKTDLVFQVAPLGIVARQMETVEMGQVMKETVEILPLILVVVVSLVGLRKALKMLFMLLRKA